MNREQYKIMENKNSNSPSPQLVPHSQEAEEAVIGSILINPEAYYDISEFIIPEDFYIHKNRWIWEAILKLKEQRISVDFLTVSEELEKNGKLDEVGGSGYLTSLINNVPTALHAVSYGKIIEQSSIRRKMISAANQIAKIAYKEDVTIETAIDEAEKSVFGISDRRNNNDLQPIRTVLDEYYDLVGDLAKKDEDFTGVPTGFKDLDKLLGGLQPSDLLIIAGRPGQGKTSFMLSIAKNAARNNKKHIAIFSMEMSNQQLVQRLISQETGIDSSKLRLGNLETNEWELFAESVDSLGSTKIFLDDTPGITPTQLRAKCRRLHLEHKLDLIIIDYIQLMQGEKRNENRTQEVSYISRNLKILAKELNVPVLTAAQLSRAIEQRQDKQPVLSDLRESGSLEQDADIVMFIHRPDKEDPESIMQNMVEIQISKHRNGPTGKIQLVFKEELAVFLDAAPTQVILNN
jgi:replicative DNA helicase